MTRRFRRHPPAWTFAAVALAGLIVWRGSTAPALLDSVLRPGDAVVIDVVDERTLLLQQGSDQPLTVRLLGLATRSDASKKPAADQTAQQWLRENLVGQSVQIELDHRRLDRDGASLAYVLLGGRFINAELISHGWAAPDNYPGDSASRGKQLREAVRER